MKIYSVFLLYCLFVIASPSTSFGEGALHTFTTPDGRSLNATIKDYNDRTGKIQLKREDGKELWTLPTVFSEPDQEYIQQWISADQFMSPMKFKITGDSSKNKISKKRTQVGYEITLENKTDFPLTNLKIEYRAFILSQGYEGLGDTSRVDGGQLLIAEIPAGEQVSKKTLSIDLITTFRWVTETSYNGGSTSYEKKTTAEHLKGFWIKVYGSAIDGTPTIREWCYPADTSDDFAWQEQITPVTRMATTTSPRRGSKESALLKEASSLAKSDPEKALELYLEAYEIAQSPHAANAIGKHLLYRHTPPNIPLGIEWMEKSATGGSFNASACLASIYASYKYPEYHDVKKALEHGLRATSMRPKDGWGHRIMAGVYAEDGQFKEAVKHQKLSIKIFRNTSRHDKDYFKKYLAILERELDLYKNDKSKYNPSDRSARHNVSQELMKSNPAKAIDLLQNAYEKSPDPKTAGSIGHTYIWNLKPPNIPLGLEWLEKAAEGNNVPACRLLALAYSTYYGYPEYYNLEKTLKYGRKALSIEPDCHTSHQAMAKAYAFGGQFDKAVEHQRIALELFKNAKGKPTPEHISNMEAMLELYRNNKIE